MNKVIDVYEGDEISNNGGFEELKNSGMGVIIKMTEGCDYKDGKGDYRARKCIEMGIPFSFYHMLTKNSNIIGQARDFYNATKDYPNTMMNALDIEYSNIPNKEDYANKFIAEYKRLSGQDLMVYSCQSYLWENFSKDFLNSHYLWVANYGGTPNLPNVVLHQYSESTKLGWVGNEEGCVDINNVWNESVLMRNGVTLSQPQTISVQTSKNEYEQHGNAEVLVDVLNIRDNPSINANIVGKYYKGETIYNYDYVYDRDGFRWVRYVGGSGNYRYVAVRDLSDNHRLCNCY